MRDTEAVASIVAGDPDGLATAYDRYADPLFTYCMSLLGGTAEAADAVQDTFVIAAARLDGLHDPQLLRPWLYAVARGECLRILRSKPRAQPRPVARDVTGDASESSEAGEAGDTADAGDTTEAGGTAEAASADAAQAAGGEREQAELRALFEDASAGLGPGDREVIELQLRQGLAPGEVATVLGGSRGRAHAAASRAEDQLETCLGVLLVGRGGRDECAELGSLLTGWDGRLTAGLSKRIDRHIQHCSACSARRAAVLRPSMMFELTPAAALAAGAAESLRRAAGAPAGLKAHTIALATEHGSASAAHAAAVLSRAGTFGRQGFPKPAQGVIGPAGAGTRHGVRSSPQGQAAIAAAVLLAAGVAVAGFALSGGQEHLKPVADPKPPASSATPPAVTTTAAAPTTAPAASPSRRSPSARATTSASAATTQAAITTPASVPTTAAPSVSPTSVPTVTQSQSATPSPTQPAGTLRVFPGGGSLFVVPGGRGAWLFLSASGGTVNWSVTVSGDPDHTITVSPAASGTLTAAHPHTAIEITASQNLNCGNGGNPCPTITIEPGGTVLTVTPAGRRHPFRHRRRHHRHDGGPAATPLQASAPVSAQPGR